MVNNTTEYINRHQALEICRSTGGHLVVVDSLEASNALKDIVAARVQQLGKIITWIHNYDA